MAPTSPILAAVASTEFEELTESSAGLSFKTSVMSTCPLCVMVSEVMVEIGWGA